MVVNGCHIDMCLIAGNNWNNSSNAGVWAVNWNNNRSDSNNNVGLRADCGFPSNPGPGMVEPQGYGIRPWAKAPMGPLFGRETEDQGVCTQQ